MEHNGIHIKSISEKQDRFVQDIIVKDESNIVLKIVKPNTTYYSYLTLSKCKFCNKKLFMSEKSLARYGYGFCDHNCQHCYTRLINDPKNANILNNKNSNFYYLLGLVATDGTIIFPETRNKYKAHALRIQLQIRDARILEFIKNEFGGKISYTKKYVTWELSNKPFLEYLISETGFTPHKSKTLNVTKWFDGLTYDQQRHFVRGCWDGDGTIYQRKDNYIISAFVSASGDFFEMIEKFFKNYEHKLYKSVTAYGANIHKISFHGKRIIAPMNIIYGDLNEDDFFLERKYTNFNKFKSILEQQ